jgi:serine/threonine protein kinase
LKEFEDEGTIGVGAYGSVHKAVHVRTGHVVAIKRIVVDRSDPVQDLAAEINVLRDLDNDHIVRYLGSYVGPPTHSHSRTHARTHARMNARTHARMHTRTHARTAAHTDARTHAHTRAHARTLPVSCYVRCASSTPLAFLRSHSHSPSS